MFSTFRGINLEVNKKMEGKEMGFNNIVINGLNIGLNPGQSLNIVNGHVYVDGKEINGSGDVKEISLSEMLDTQGVEYLVIKSSAMYIELNTSKGPNVEVKAVGKAEEFDINCRVNNGTLYIEPLVRGFSNGVRIQVSIPEALKFKASEIEVNSGTVLIQNLNAESITFKVGSGELTIKRENSRIISGKVGSGDFEIEVAREDNPTITASVGTGDINSDFPIYTSRSKIPGNVGKLIELKVGSGDATISAL